MKIIWEMIINMNDIVYLFAKYLLYLTHSGGRKESTRTQWFQEFIDVRE